MQRFGTKRFGVTSKGVPGFGTEFNPLMISNLEFYGKIDDSRVTTASGAVSAITDLTGNHTIVQGTAGHRPAYSNGVITLDGTDDHLDIGTNVTISTNDFAFWFWVSVSDTAAAKRIIGSDNSNNFSVFIEAGGTLRMNFNGVNNQISTATYEDDTERLHVVNCDRDGNIDHYAVDMETPEKQTNFAAQAAVDLAARTFAIGADTDASQPLPGTMTKGFGFVLGGLLTESQRKKIKVYR